MKSRKEIMRAEMLQKTGHFKTKHEVNIEANYVTPYLKRTKPKNRYALRFIIAPGLTKADVVKNSKKWKRYLMTFRSLVLISIKSQNKNAYKKAMDSFKYS